MNYESIEELISNIKNELPHELIEDSENSCEYDHIDEAIVAFALRFLASNLNDREVVEYLKDCLA